MCKNISWQQHNWSLVQYVLYGNIKQTQVDSTKKGAVAVVQYIKNDNISDTAITLPINLQQFVKNTAKMQ